MATKKKATKKKATKKKATKKRATKKKATKKKATKKKATKKKAAKRRAASGTPPAGSKQTSPKGKRGTQPKDSLPHIAGIGLKNFKCFSDLPVLSLTPITVLTGPNSCGKSSVIQALVLLKQSLESSTAQSTLVFNDMVKLGSAQRVLTSGSGVNNFSIELMVHAPLYTGGAPDPGDHENWLVTLSFGPSLDEKKSSQVQRIQLSPLGEKPLLTITPREQTTGEDEPEFWATFHSKEALENTSTPLGNQVRVPYKAKMSLGFISPENVQVKWKSKGDRRPEMLPFQFFFPSIDRVFRALEFGLTQQLAYIGPLRTEPADLYVQNTRRIGVRGENCMAYLRAHQKDKIRDGMPGGGSAPLLECVNAWLVRLGASSGIRFERMGDLHFEVLTQDSRHLNEVGCGVGQLLPVVVQCLTAMGDEVVLLEQPEIHLHQRLQAGLADLVLACRSRGVRFVVETHSEIFIQRLRRRIAESQGKDLRDDVSVHFGEGNRFISIEIDHCGAVNMWPEHFFDQGLKEMRALANAASGKRTSEA